MRVLSAILLASLFAGCMQPSPAPDERGAPLPVSCPWRPPPQVAQVSVAGHHVRTPDGYTEGGRYHEFSWSANNATLVRLDVRLEWEANGPLTQDLMLGLPRRAGFDYFAHGPFNGPSPILASIPFPDKGVLRDPLQVDFGASQNQTPAGGLARPEQPARLTIQETYDPCLRRG